MKKRILSIILCLLMALGMCTLSLAEESITLVMGEADVTVAKGKAVTLTWELPEGMDLGKPTKTQWKTSDKAVATVANGKVAGKKPGEATVTVTVTYKGGETATGSVQVTVYQPVASVALKEKKLNLNVGESSEALTVTVKPKDAGYAAVAFTSDNEAVATVDANGVVTGVGPGSAKITATSKEPVDGKAKPKSAFCQVTVKQPVTGVTMTAEASVLKGKTLDLTEGLVVAPDNATNPKIVWESSDKKVATVTNGKVKGLNGGSVTITARAADGSGAAAECTVTVMQPVTGLTAANKKVSVGEEKTVQLAVTVKPDNAFNKAVTWSSSDDSVATVDADGVVTGVRMGKCVVTATAADGSGKTCAFNVTVDAKYAISVVEGSASGFTYWGKGYNSIVIKVKNVSTSRTIRSFKFMVEANPGTDKTALMILEYDENKLSPGKSEEVEWNLPISLTGNAFANRYAVSLYEITYTDGTSETINPWAQQGIINGSSFTRTTVPVEARPATSSGQVTSADYIGKWVSTDGVITMEVRQDGSGTVYVGNKATGVTPYNLTWKMDGKKLTLVQGDSLPIICELDGDKLTMNLNGLIYEMYK